MLRATKPGTSNAPRLRAVDLVCAKIINRIEDVITEQKQKDGASAPKLLVDHDEREPYRRFQESKGPLNQIQIMLPSKQLVDLAERSRVVSSIDKFKLDRVYVSDNDGISRGLVEKIIHEEVQNAKS